MNSSRVLLFAFSLLLSFSASSQYANDRLWPTSVAINTAGVIPFTTWIYNADGTPAIGVPFLYQSQSCGRFEEGQEMSGVTDEQGRAVSSTFYGGPWADLGCRVYLYTSIEGTSGYMSTAIYDPALVTMQANQASLETITNFDYQVGVTMIYSYAFGVNEGPPEVAFVGQSDSGATAVATGAECFVNSGFCAMKFRSNDRPGKYEVHFRYRDQILVVPIKQRPS
jgi:hypothetical protein